MRVYQYGEVINGYTLVKRGWVHRDSYIFQCACGGEFQSSIGNIKKRKLPGCHHCSTMFAFDDISGNTYGLLTVVKRVENIGKRPAYLCLCACGKHKVVTAHSLKLGTTKTCGDLEHRRGINSKCYRGGRAPREHQDGYIAWRGSVFRRDNYTCRVCGARGGVELNAHHIVPHNSNVELRTDINNGVTMCKLCHTAFHKEYGYTNPALPDLLEFLCFRTNPYAMWEYEDLVLGNEDNWDVQKDAVFLALHGNNYRELEV